jgi:hypothetical protein
VTIRRESLPEVDQAYESSPVEDGYDSGVAYRKDSLDMSSKLSESLIVSNLAEQVCQQITRKVISSLQALKNGLLPGDDSGVVLQIIWRKSVQVIWRMRLSLQRPRNASNEQ